jgi:hypothetical protein
MFRYPKGNSFSSRDHPWNGKTINSRQCEEGNMAIYFDASFECHCTLVYYLNESWRRGVRSRVMFAELTESFERFILHQMNLAHILTFTCSCPSPIFLLTVSPFQYLGIIFFMHFSFLPSARPTNAVRITLDKIN